MSIHRIYHQQYIGRWTSGMGIGSDMGMGGLPQYTLLSNRENDHDKEGEDGEGIDKDNSGSTDSDTTDIEIRNEYGNCSNINNDTNKSKNRNKNSKNNSKSSNDNNGDDDNDYFSDHNLEAAHQSSLPPLFSSATLRMQNHNSRFDMKI